MCATGLHIVIGDQYQRETMLMGIVTRKNKPKIRVETA
jgi:hypothetical protein